jgi:hypothetical protein
LGVNWSIISQVSCSVYTWSIILKLKHRVLIEMNNMMEVEVAGSDGYRPAPNLFSPPHHAGQKPKSLAQGRVLIGRSSSVSNQASYHVSPRRLNARVERVEACGAGTCIQSRLARCMKHTAVAAALPSVQALQAPRKQCLSLSRSPQTFSPIQLSLFL